MDIEVPILAGWIGLVPTQTGFSLYKKKPCHKYCLLFKSSRHGIERLEICESKDDKNAKIITLENCVKITQEPAPANLIQIVKKTGTLTLSTLNEDELREWVNALQTVAFRDKSFLHESQLVIEEDNDLYCSSLGDGLFIVTLIPSDTSIRCNIEQKAYMLHLTATELQLKSTEDLNVIISTWPYRFIRKYGYRDGKFTFEAGRKCTTGEGVFTLDHTNPQEIFRCMSAKMKSMKKLISGDNINSNECTENTLSAAASMEAGSRSPLPPSPSNQRSSEFEMNSTPSCNSLRGLLSSSDSLNNFSVNSATSVKHIPSKPPRKIQGQLDIYSASSSSSSISHSTTPLPLDINIKTHNQQSSEKYKQFQNYEPVTITTSTDPNRTVGSTVILKPPSPEPFRKANVFPDLPMRNDTIIKPVTTERDYESIENITDAWKTLGISDIKHTERIAQSSSGNNDDLIDFGWQRTGTGTGSHREKLSIKENVLPSVKKIIDIDIGEPGTCIHPIITDATYDRLDFLSPNNKTSNSYKTIVNVKSIANRMRNSPQSANDYEPIASPDTQPCRTADDSHLGYGVVRKSNNSLTRPTEAISIGITSSANISSNPNAALIENTEKIMQRSTVDLNDSSLDHRNYNGFNYTIVSKPRRV